ncbi:MAG: mannose-1-phosphate guanylyltransferase [Ornithinimicrobium sp.]
MGTQQQGASAGTPAALPSFYAVVPAGGAGTRLWPLSRADRPKFFHDLTGSGQSLLQQTAHRLRPLCAERLMVVTGPTHAAEVAESLPSLVARNLLVEPSPKDSLPAIGGAAAVAALRDPEAVIGSFAADHIIEDEAAFRRCVTTAVAVAQRDVLVTLGVQPTYAATGFGYIRPGPACSWHADGTESAYRVESFVEKPSAEVAERYVGEGHLWNAGMFVVRADVLLRMIEQWQPELAGALRAAAADPAAIESRWASVSARSIDRAVAEPAADAGQVVVVPADFDWDDLGTFRALHHHLADDPHRPGLRVLGGGTSVVSVESTGLVVARGDRTVTLLGIQDVVIVDTPDALLVSTRDRVEDVSTVVQALHRGGREDLT